MIEKKLDVVIVGELNIDLVLWDVPMPENEKEKLAEDMRFSMGSSSAITAHNLSMIGSRVGFIGKAGKDIFGDFMIQRLESAGVETSRIIQDSKLKTGATIVLANPPKKALLTYMGAMTKLTIDDIDWEYVKQACHLHLGCYFLQPGIRHDVPELFVKAKEFGLTTSLDTNWDPDEKWGDELQSALEFTDIFLPNDDEAIRIAHADDLDQAINILSKKVKVLAVKCGSNGAIVCANGKKYSAPIFNADVVETTGAGDSFNAGFLHKYLQGDDWSNCLKFGNACGALAVTALGGTGAFLYSDKLHSQLGKLLDNE